MVQYTNTKISWYKISARKRSKALIQILDGRPDFQSHELKTQFIKIKLKIVFQTQPENKTRDMINTKYIYLGTQATKVTK